jgi:RNA polymerase sigma-70 factor, ECF subfamily
MAGGAGRAADARPGAMRPTPTAGADAFVAFVHAHERPILNYLWRMSGDEQSAYDLTQETFLRAWQRFERVRGYEDPRGWLFRVATNLALTAHARRRAQISESALGGAEPSASDPAWRLAEADQVRATLRQLNPQRRAALLLREVYGLSCAEVAKSLGISEPAARMALSRAREQFRDLYLRADRGEDGDQHDA